MSTPEQGRVTYDHVRELERAGMSRKRAFEQIAAAEGVSVGAVSQRYYVARRRDEPDAEPAPRTRRSRPAAASSNGDLASAKILEAARLLNEAAELLPQIQRDADRWNQLRPLLSD